MLYVPTTDAVGSLCIYWIIGPVSCTWETVRQRSVLD